MIVNYSDQEIVKEEKGIFLAGPTPRGKDTISWRTEAVKILEDLGFDGVVYVPEYSTWKPKADYVDQAMWERQGLNNADVIVFWVPRHFPDMMALTTNVEFGYFMHTGKIVYGRPETAEKIKYLDWLYQLDMKEKPFNSLEELLRASIDKVNLNKLRAILLSDNVEEDIRKNEEFIFSIIPVLKNEKGFMQNNPWHKYDVWNHTIKAVSSTSKDFELRLVLLLHDIGKPFSYQDDSKGRHFNGHAKKSEELSKNILSSLGIRDEMLEEMLFLIGNHATKIDMSMINKDNVLLYKKLILIQMSDGYAYEEEHSKVILEELNGTKEKIDSLDIKRLVK